MSSNPCEHALQATTDSYGSEGSLNPYILKPVALEETMQDTLPEWLNASKAFVTCPWSRSASIQCHQKPMGILLDAYMYVCVYVYMYICIYV